ncbi:hypothetical protein FB565_001540 [Actinoplanes lutulentus]|uniref:DUF4145 domain-containing protein n=1 Tax=Actinoplanes lutulentus TaxID=1287878 RepID=A0A327ZFL4_9ACTN|nr:hypothetical protein [Actinoplanes lutulentus]MBB2941836.1 hypothetical protein [Actinoplanes lutulentus]RAK39754.1 hypothetical protein B0I29_104292 [Actinoplanes lutulentus]
MTDFEDQGLPAISQDAEEFLNAAMEEIKNDVRSRAQVAANLGGLTSEPAGVRDVALAVAQVRITDEVAERRARREQRLIQLTDWVTAVYAIIGAALLTASNLGWLATNKDQYAYIGGILLGSAVPTFVRAIMLNKNPWRRRPTAPEISTGGSIGSMFLERWIAIEQIIRKSSDSQATIAQRSALPLSVLIHEFAAARNLGSASADTMIALLKFRNKALHNPDEIRPGETAKMLRDADKMLRKLRATS